MAMSLEELLTEEGFGGRISKTVSRTSFTLDAGSERLLQFRYQHNSGSSSGIKKAATAKSDITSYKKIYESPISDKFKGKSLKDSYVSLSRQATKKTTENYGRRRFTYSEDDANVYSGYQNDNSTNVIGGSSVNNEIVDTLEQDIEDYENTSSNEVYNKKRGNGKYSRQENRGDGYNKVWEKNIQVHKSYVESSSKSSNLRHNNRLNMIETQNSKNDGSHKSSQKTGSLDYKKSERKTKMEQIIVSEPALDAVAIRAVVSILTGYIKRFSQNEDFRVTLHRSCYASLNLTGSDGINIDCNIIDNLEQAIVTVERAAEDCTSTNKLKKASLQLSVITGLGSCDLRNGFTSGICNFKLSACAHLYLSVIYKLQAKDSIAAKHLLQVFSDSPFQARTHLLPELWDFMFVPHLSHLKFWYDKEMDCLQSIPSKANKTKLLEKVYNESLDSSTYQLAVYYRDWLTEGTEAPSLPSFHIPSIRAWEVHLGGLLNYSSEDSSPCSSSSYPMVSKKLYDSVFGSSSNSNVQVATYEELESYENSLRSAYGFTAEEKQALPSFSKTDEDITKDMKPDGSSNLADELLEERMEVQKTVEPSVTDTCEESDNSSIATLGCTPVAHAFPNMTSNEFTLKTLVKSVFQQQAMEHTKKSYSVEEFHVNKEDFDGPFLSCIPQDFICPLTGLLFKDPVTLETGQTFERASIAEWFSKGNKMCPITGNVLECQSLPHTNFILRSIIERWKSDYFMHLMDFVSCVISSQGDHMKFNEEKAVFLLESSFSSLSIEERIEKANQLASLGGLSFLIKRFHCGNLEEKSCVAALLSYCIAANGFYRIKIGRNISVPFLLELLHCNHERSRNNIVMLLVELICLNRRRSVNSILNCFRNEELMNAKRVLLFHLQNCSREQRPLVAVLLLQFDLSMNPPRHSIYREEAIDAIIVALNDSISDKKVCELCCKSLLILGGCVSRSGNITIEGWILKQAGFLDGPELEHAVDEDIPLDEDEEEARKKWWINLSESLLTDGNNSFLEAVSNCLVTRNIDLVWVCLVTLAWLSFALDSLSETKLPQSALSTLISQLQASMKHGERVEQKILASISLYNLCKIPECKELLGVTAEEMVVSLHGQWPHRSNLNSRRFACHHQ